MDNPQYIEYLNTFGAEIDVNYQPIIEVDASIKKHTTEEKELKITRRLFKKFFYHIRYKYYQFYNMVKHFPLDKEEEKRQRLIDSIDKLKGAK